MVIRGAEEGASVVDYRLHPRVVVWSFWMIGLPGQKDGGIDLDGVHVLGARAQSGRYVVSGAGAYDSYSACFLTNPVGKIIVIARGAKHRVGSRPDGGIREVINSLVIMAGGSNEHESVLAVTEVERLIWRIDLIPQGVDWPGESYQGGDGKTHNKKKSSRFSREKEK